MPLTTEGPRGRLVDFLSLEDFLARTARDDRALLPEEELSRLPAVACGMANGAGGWILLGAEPAEAPSRGEEEVAVKGIADPFQLRRSLSLELGRRFSSPLPISFHDLPGPPPLLLLHVRPVDWNQRPVCVRGNYLRGVYRRVEGVDLISGLGARFRLGMDALERLRDDRPAAAKDSLHQGSVESFREAVLQHRPEWSGLPMDALLSRTLVLSHGAVTGAGNYLLGKRGVRVRVELQMGGGGEALEARNLWRAYSDLLPRLTRSLSPACSAAFRECFLNALLHADYDAGSVTISLTGNPLSVRMRNPGLPRVLRTGESACRNFRLMKIFQLLGAASGEGRGLRIIQSYQPGFRLEQDALELSTVAELALEPMASLREPEPELSVDEGTPLLLAAAPPEPEPEVPQELEPETPGPEPESNSETPEPEPEVPQPEAEPQPEAPEPPARHTTFGSAAEELAQAVALAKGGEIS